MILIGIPMKLTISIFLWIILQFTPSVYANNYNNSNINTSNNFNDYSSSSTSSSYLYMLSLLLILLINEIASTLIFISMMSFFSKISDPSIGRSYMTLCLSIYRCIYLSTYLAKFFYIYRINMSIHLSIISL